MLNEAKRLPDKIPAKAEKAVLYVLKLPGGFYTIVLEGWYKIWGAGLWSREFYIVFS